MLNEDTLREHMNGRRIVSVHCCAAALTNHNPAKSFPDGRYERELRP